MLEKIRERVERYLQIDCDDFWSVYVECAGDEDIITGKYAGIWAFSLEFDGDEFHFSGHKIHTDIVKNICEIAEEFTKEQENERY